jgi:molybdate transport system substrate-binding protein
MGISAPVFLKLHRMAFSRLCASSVRAVTFLLALLCCGAVHSAQITVFAASSLTDSLKEIAVDYEKRTGDIVVFNFAASSLLARQIEEGAPADIFFSADEARMNALDAKGLVVRDTRNSPLSNLLVIVVPKDAPSALHSVYDLTNAAVQRIAMGDPKTVPIGVYAREYLKKLGSWKAIEGKLLIAENVRAALAAVEAGNADAAIVYRTDAAIGKGVKIAVEIPRTEGPAISYSMALLKNVPHPETARKFLDELKGRGAAKIFSSFGFILQEETPK